MTTLRVCPAGHDMTYNCGSKAYLTFFLVGFAGLIHLTNRLLELLR